MWKLIQISQRPYLMKCVFDVDNKVTLIIFNQKESWCETLTLDELKRKAKLLNRRYDFSSENVRDALFGSDPELVTLGQTDDRRTGKIALTLKYRVKNCPFQFEWSLKKQTMQEFQTSFIGPLCSAVMGCHEQIEILTETLKKKDAEILQYRKEGAILTRKTLATKLFDFDEFAKKYEANNNAAVNFSEMAKLLPNLEANREIVAPINEQTKQQESPEKKETAVKTPTVTTLSPGQRKRKIQELQQKHLERNLKKRKQTITYLSSQSQDTSTGSSQSTEINLEVKTSTKSPEKIAEDKLESVETKTDKPKNEDLNTSNIKEENASEIIPNSQLKYSSSQKPDQTATNTQKDKDSNIITNSPLKITPTTSNPKQKAEKTTTATTEAKELKESIEIKSDSEEDIILTPIKVTQTRKTRGRPNTIGSDTESDSCHNKKIKQNLSRSLNEEKDKMSVKSPLRNKALRSLAFKDVVELSTDSDDSVSNKNHVNRYPKRRNTTTTPVKSKGRVTRSSPQEVTVAENKEPPRRRNSIGTIETQANFKILETPTKSKVALSETTTSIVGEISSQIETIRKELESLEAMRLADLKQRAS